MSAPAFRAGPFASDAGVYDLVAAFEGGTLPLDAFGHGAHVAVGLAYLEAAALPEATARMREGLRRLLAVHGQAGAYHETLTVFWMRLLDHLARGPLAPLALFERANAAAAAYPGRHAIAAHYSHERVFSDAARAAWVEPDVLPLPF